MGRLLPQEVWWVMFGLVRVVTEVWVKDCEKKCGKVQCGANCGDCSVGWPSPQESRAIRPRGVLGEGRGIEKSKC